MADPGGSVGSSSSVDLADVRAAAVRLDAVLPRTPLIHSGAWGAWLKLESLQLTGAYKVRGALNAVLCALEQGDHRPVVAASAGNHGAGVAWAAQHVGLPAVVAVPEDAPSVKVERIAALGAEVQRVGRSFEESLQWARAYAEQAGARLIHAFDDPQVIAGQGTIAFELLGVRPDVVLVPVGGGGLAAGISLVLRAAGVRLVGVQIEGVDAMASVLRGGPDRIVPRPTVADGIRVGSPGQLTRILCRRGLERVVLVREDEVRLAMSALYVQEGLVVEGAGAVAVAGLARVPGQRRVALVTGGNVSESDVADFIPVQRLASNDSIYLTK